MRNLDSKLVWLALIIMLAVSCAPSDTPPATNSYQNEVTDRQKVVDWFHTSEVIKVPYSTISDYMVQDTNGAVWFVRISRTSEQGMTKIFAPFVAGRASPPDYFPSTFDQTNQPVK
jgi:hypothetical protein